jgi:hypothetical protein
MKTYLFVLILIAHSLVHSQNVLTSAGDYNESTAGSLSWTLGEPVSETLNNIHILTQGFQQDYEHILSVESLAEILFPLVYPNPFNSSLHLDLSSFNFSKEEIALQLSDNCGRMILEDTFQEILYTDNLSNGIYHLVITVGNDKRFVYKLIKTAN